MAIGRFSLNTHIKSHYIHAKFSWVSHIFLRRLSFIMLCEFPLVLVLSFSEYHILILDINIDNLISLSFPLLLIDGIYCVATLAGW